MGSIRLASYAAIPCSAEPSAITPVLALAQLLLLAHVGFAADSGREVKQ